MGEFVVWTSRREEQRKRKKNREYSKDEDHEIRRSGRLMSR